MSIDNCKFQFVEQLKAAVSIFGDGCSCIDVILGLWVVLFNGSILVVQTGRNPCKEWYKAAYSGFRYLLQILPWQIKSIRILIFYLYLHNNLQHFASFCASLHFASQPLHSHIFLECGKMRQISASKSSQNVVKIAIIDYCNF